MKTTDPFPALLRSFFQEWLAEQRNASVHTIRSYRDTWRLFLRFVAERKRKEVAEIRRELQAAARRATLTAPRAGSLRIEALYRNRDFGAEA